MTTLATYQRLERVTALLRARVIFLGDFFFCSFFYSAYTFFFVLFFSLIFSDITINLVT